MAAAGAYGRRGRGTAGRQAQQRRGNDERRLPVAIARTAAFDRVNKNLARLLGAIWRKLREESALLDFFLRVDRETETQQHLGRRGGGAEAVSAASAAPEIVRLDVFERLLPLLELPGRAGLHAREACLVALSVKDRRVGEFVAGRTHLCVQLSRTLTARYLALYDTLEELHVVAAVSEQREREDYGVGSEGGVARLRTQSQPEQAEATFADALSLFLQHLRFSNAVGLVAADTKACLRPPSRPVSGISNGEGGQWKGTENNTRSAVAQKTGALKEEEGSEGSDDVAASLASHVRQLFLAEAVGPALSSALESRAGFAQAIAARAIAELSAGVEGYGVAVAGIAASVGEGGGFRRQLGPLLDTVSCFLVGRDGSGGSSAVGDRGEGLLTSPDGNTEAAVAAAASTSTSGSMVVINSTSGSNLSLRDVLLRRVESSCPSLRVSTLQLLASLAELRDDRVLLDLALRPESRSQQAVAVNSVGRRTLSSLTPPAPEAGEPEQDEGPVGDDAIRVSATPLQGDGVAAPHHRQPPLCEGIQAILDVSASGGALDGLRVSRAIVDSFGSAFSGSPIHPTFRRFASSHVSLEEYLVAAHQRQIQQLMEGSRTCHGDENAENQEEEREAPQPVANQGAADEGSTAVGEGHGRGIFAGEGTETLEVAGTGGGGTVAAEISTVEGKEFDAAGFVRAHGVTLATAADAEGSFIYALFDCLEVSSVTRGRLYLVFLCETTW